MRIPIGGLVFLGAWLVLLAGTSIASTDMVTVEGTKHDLSANPAITGADDPCLYCHGQPGQGDAEYELSRTETTTAFTQYASITMKATVGSPGSASRFCMSCHDGTTPFDALHGSAGTTNNNLSTVFPDSKSIVGTDLRNLHPVGVGINADAININDRSIMSKAGLKLFDGKIECTTCHDPHGKGGYTAMLRMDPANSTLCLVCHEK